MVNMPGNVLIWKSLLGNVLMVVNCRPAVVEAVVEEVVEVAAGAVGAGVEVAAQGRILKQTSIFRLKQRAKYPLGIYRKIMKMYNNISVQMTSGTNICTKNYDSLYFGICRANPDDIEFLIIVLEYLVGGGRGRK